VVNSQAAFHGHHVVRANGSAPDPTSAGVRVDGSSHVFLDDLDGQTAPPEVVDNLGPGILVDLNSSLDSRASTVQGNAGEAVRVQNMSVAYLGPGTSVASNTGGPLSCDRTSLVITSLVGRGAACQQVQAPSAPRPPRPPMPK